MQKKIRMAFIVDSLGVGGGEKHTISLFNRLNSEIFDLMLVYLKNNKHLLSSLHSSRGVIHCAEFGNGWDKNGLRNLARCLKKFNPHLLIAVNTYPLFYSHLAKIYLRHKPIIIEIFHTGKCFLIEALKMHLIYRWLFHMSDQIVYVSDFQKKYWMSRGFIGRNNNCIYNGVDTNYFTDQFSSDDKLKLRNKLGFRDTDLIVGLCAAMRPEKYHQNILEALRISKKNKFLFKILMIGDGPTRPEIEKIISSYGLEHDVRITGFVMDVRPYLSICDCLVISSNKVENFSISVLEGMSMGKPIVASDIGGIREQIKDGKEGFIYKIGCTDDLIQCINKISQKEVRERMGKNAYYKVRKHFDINSMVSEYEKLFLNIAERNKFA